MCLCVYVYRIFKGKKFKLISLCLMLRFCVVLLVVYSTEACKYCSDMFKPRRGLRCDYIFFLECYSGFIVLI